jgi:hypothetical protein
LKDVGKRNVFFFFCAVTLASTVKGLEYQERFSSVVGVKNVFEVLGDARNDHVSLRGMDTIIGGPLSTILA